MTRPRNTKREQHQLKISQIPAERDTVRFAIIVPVEGGWYEAEGSFSLEVWKAARTDPSPAQFIVGTLREALEAKGYKEGA